MLEFRSYGPSTALHAHDFVQVVMPAQGVLEMEVDGRGGRVDGRHVAVITPGAMHAFGATGKNRFIVLDAIDAPDLGALGERVFVELTPSLRALMSWLEVSASDGIARSLADAWSSLALASLAAHPANASVASARIDRRAERTWQSIERRFAESLTLDELAADVGLSSRRLATVFRAAYGVSVHARLAEVRVRRAAEMLETTGLSISEIATRTGYYDQSALTRQLKGALGVTPAALRRSAEVRDGRQGLGRRRAR